MNLMIRLHSVPVINVMTHTMDAHDSHCENRPGKKYFDSKFNKVATKLSRKNYFLNLIAVWCALGALEQASGSVFQTQPE